MSDGVLCACDLCHSRKVKCDRQPFCANCADAGLQCRRTRPTRANRPDPTLALSSLGERVLKLESVLPKPPKDAIAIQEFEEYHQDIRDGASKKRKINETSETQDDNKSPQGGYGTISPADSSHYAERAKAIIQSELEGNDSLKDERQSIMKSALEFVNGMAERPAMINDGMPLEFPDVDFPKSPEDITPKPELFYMLFREPTVANNGIHRIQWPDHISDSVLQKIATTLLEPDTDSQLFYQYCICIYMKSILRIMQMPRAYTNPSIKSYFDKSIRQYQSYALYALRHLNILSAPSLSLIQALVSAAQLMQYLGNMGQSWVFTSYAARLIISLNYHEIKTSDLPVPHEEEIKGCLFCCYYLDRTLGALFRRPLSLPEPVLSVSELSSIFVTDAHATIMPVVLDLARVQGELLKCSKLSDNSMILARHSDLNDQMTAMYPKLHCSTRTYGNDVLSCEWLAAEFAYHAILVDIMRSRLKYAFSPLTHRECISHSRTALRAMLSIQKNLARTPGYEDPFPSFLTWTILLYPLSPFFVLFCNVIGEMNKDDYNIIQSILQGLSQFAASPYVSKLYKLLETLQSLSQSLLDAKERLDPQKKVTPWYPTGKKKDQLTSNDAQDNFVIGGEDFMGVPERANPQVNPSDEELMWHLFTSNISLDWFDTSLATPDPNLYY